MQNRLFLVLCLTLCLWLTGVAEAAQQIRVALVRGQAAAELSCEGAFKVRNGGEEVLLPSGKYFLRAQDNNLILEKRPEVNVAKGEKQVNGEQADPAIWQYFGAITVLAQDEQHLPKLNQRAYRGVLKIEPQGTQLLVVNAVDLEAYLASVLPAKTMVVWPDEVLKAQAVAARSYALYKQREQAAAAYDLTAQDAELVYEGTGERMEKAAVTRQVLATAGQYLATADGLPILAVTTSSSGGRTESAAEAWGREIAYLRSVEDDDSDSPDYTWEERVTPAILETQLAQRGYTVGKLHSVRLSSLDAPDADRTTTGRVRYVIITGSTGSARLSGGELATIVNLPSTLFDLETGTPPPDKLRIPIEDRYGFEVGSKDIKIKLQEGEKPVWNKLLRSYHLLSGAKEEKLIFRGKGRGSGLGLSAWGARGLVNADANLTYAELLAHYYPGTYIRR